MDHNHFFSFTELIPHGIQILKTVLECSKSTLVRKVNPAVDPGFLRSQLPTQPPQEGCPFQELCRDTQDKIFPGVLLWQSPKFFAYYPTTICEVGLYAELVAAAFTCPGFSYAVSPSHTQLENIVVDWAVYALGLPQKFLFRNSGGGVIQLSMSEAVYLTIHAAKVRKVKQLALDPLDPRNLRLVAYVPESAHVAPLRGMMLKDINFCRKIPCNFDPVLKNFTVDLVKFEQQIKQDIEEGLIPFFCSGSIGTTFSGAVDPISGMAAICQKYGIWFNIDAAYLGSTWIHPSFRDTQAGVELADSISINFSKPLFMGTGGSLLYVANKEQFTRSLSLTSDFSFYKNKYTDECEAIDYKDWQVGLNRKNNSIKLYYIFKYYGVKKIAESIQSRHDLAKYLESLIQASPYFEMFSPVSFGLVCFNLRGGQDKYELTKKLSARIKDTEEGYMTPAVYKNYAIIRIVINNTNTTKEHIDNYWSIIKNEVERFLAQQKSEAQI